MVDRNETYKKVWDYLILLAFPGAIAYLRWIKQITGYIYKADFSKAFNRYSGGISRI